MCADVYERVAHKQQHQQLGTISVTINPSFVLSSTDATATSGRVVTTT